jgi:zinc D-Ala-D-Ala carboxypeptidase
MYDFFADDEFERIGSDPSKMSPTTMEKLVELRRALGEPLGMNSAWRSVARNTKVGGSKNSPHLYGKAVDLRVHGDTAFRVVTMAEQFGFTGIGVRQKGPVASRFIHLDDMEFSDTHYRPTIWSY